MKAEHHWEAHSVDKMKMSNKDSVTNVLPFEQLAGVMLEGAVLLEDMSSAFSWPQAFIRVLYGDFTRLDFVMLNSVNKK